MAGLNKVVAVAVAPAAIAPSVKRIPASNFRKPKR